MAMEISSSRPRGNAWASPSGDFLSSRINEAIGMWVGGGGLASGGLWEHWPDVTVDVHGISRDEINAYLQQYDAALCVFIVCESLLICSNSHGESDTRIGTKCKGCRVLHLLSRALRHVSHPNKALSVHADNVTKHRSEKLKELTVDSSHSQGAPVILVPVLVRLSYHDHTYCTVDVCFERARKRLKGPFG